MLQIFLEFSVLAYLLRTGVDLVIYLLRRMSSWMRGLEMFLLFIQVNCMIRSLISAFIFLFMFLKRVSISRMLNRICCKCNLSSASTFMDLLLKMYIFFSTQLLQYSYGNDLKSENAIKVWIKVSKLRFITSGLFAGWWLCVKHLKYFSTKNSKSLPPDGFYVLFL